MTYTIVNTAGTTVATVNEAEVNSNFDVTLIGKNYTNYGQIFNDNMYRLLENFAAPDSHLLKPVKGQIWFNTTDNTLNLYDGSSWNSFGGTALTVKGTKVGVNNRNPEFDMDIVSTLRTKGAAWINYQGHNDSDANQAGLILGTVAKGTLPTNNSGTIGIWSSEGATSRLQAQFSLKTDPVQTNRRLAIGVIEQGSGWRNITLAEQGGQVGIGTSMPAGLLTVMSNTDDGIITTDGTYTGFLGPSNLGGIALGTQSNDSLVLFTNNTAGIMLDNMQNVGIGDVGTRVLEQIETYPTVDIRGSAGGGMRYGTADISGLIYADQSGITLGSYTADPVVLVSNNTEHMRLTPAGNWGINNPNPQNKLDMLTTNHSEQGIRISSDGNQWVQMFASLGLAAYNPAVQAGDSAIIYSAGTINTGRFVIAPWGDTKSGIVLDNTGKFGTNTLSTVSFTGNGRGAFTLNDINSVAGQWTAIDFSNPALAELPLSRIASQYTRNGTYLSLGTSNNLGSGITNQAITIDPAGHVGINTNTPAQQLDVKGDVALRGMTYLGSNMVQNITADDNTLYINGDSVSFSDSTGRLNTVYIDPRGYVGINTITPTDYLNIVTSDTNSGILVDDGNVKTILHNSNSVLGQLGTTTNHGLNIITNNADRIKIAATGSVSIPNDVGIGGIAHTNTGVTTLSIDGTNQGGVVHLYRQGVLTGGISVINSNFNINAVGGNKVLAMGVNDTTYLTIDATGSIIAGSATGAGQGSGTINAQGLYINGVAVTAGPRYTPAYPVTTGETWNSNPASGQGTYYWGTNDNHVMTQYSTSSLNVAHAGTADSATSATNATNATNATTAATANALNTSNNYQVNSLGVGGAAPNTTGQIRATGDIIAFYSDARLKDNIELIVNPLDKLLKLRGVTYTQNQMAERFGYNDYQSQVGVIAQDVAAVLPEAVVLAPFDTDAQGISVTGENYMTVKYEKLVPLLIEAIKELTAKVTDLEARIK